jgi:hypothetical protein
MPKKLTRLFALAGAVVLTGLAALGAASPAGAGTGEDAGDCGEVLLVVDSSTHNFSIYLTSFDGDISGGWYQLHTDGIGNFTQWGGSGAFQLNGTEASIHGVVSQPGLNPHSATMWGVANTIEGPCEIGPVIADWTSDDIAKRPKAAS